jgi:hypothetical protein
MNKKINILLLFVFISVFLFLFIACTPSNTPTYGSIDIQSKPSGAKVYIDGIDTGKFTPYIETNIETGAHTVRLELFQYQTKEDTNVMIVPEETTVLFWELIKAPEQIITIQSGKDTKDACVSSEHSSWNYNSFDLSVGSDTVNSVRRIYRMYLQFDLSPLPSNAVVLDAKLALQPYLFPISIVTTPMQAGVFQVESPWEEDMITWDNQPICSNLAKDIIEIPYNPGINFVYWNISDLVQGWQDGNITNNGMMVRVVDENMDYGYIGFWSSDYSDVSKRPKLEVMYYIP